MEILRTIQRDDYQFTKVKFGDICRNVAIRVDNPKESGTDYYVGLEHPEPLNLKIKNSGSPNDVVSSKFRFKKNQILFGRRRAYQRKLAVADKDGICSTDIFVLEPAAIIVKGFLQLFMQSEIFFQKVLMLSAGSLSPRVKWQQIAKLKEHLTRIKLMRMNTLNFFLIPQNEVLIE